MKKTKKLLAMITLMTMTSTLALQTETSAAVINQTKDNTQIEDIETKDEEKQVQETEMKDEVQVQDIETKDDAKIQSTEEKDDVQIQENETKDNIQMKESEIKDNTQIQEVETNKNIDSIEAVKRYEENLESLYVEKEASSTALSISSFSSDLKSPQEKGKTIKLTAKAQGGSGKIQYSFVAKLNGYYKEIKSYSEINTASWEPQYVGTYTIYAVAKDSTGSLKISSMDYNIKEVSAPVITSFTADKASPQASGTKINLTAKATGTGTLKYKFLIKDSKNNWFVIRDFGTTNTTVWTTGSTGDKTLYVDVKSENGKVTRKEMSYKVISPLKITSFTADKTSPQASGTKINLTAKATGEGTLKYKFLIKDSKNNWFVIRDFGTTNTTVWTAGSAGDKTLYVDVKDSTGKVVRKEMSYKVISPLKITSFTTDKASPQVVGTNVKLKANATGSGTLQYKFLIRDSAGKWYVIKNYSTSNEITWTPGSEGSKTLYVDVKDSTGKVVRKEISYTIKSPTKLTGKVVEADGDTDYTNNKVLSNATVKITKNGVTQTKTTDANGVYSFEKLMDGAYTITVSKEGYKTSTQTVNIPEGQANYYNSTIELISNTSVADGTASGTIYDVLTGNGVKGLTLKIRSGIGNTTGTVVKTIKTGEGGKYSVTLPSGNYCVQIIDERTISNESERYLTNTFDIKTLGNKTIDSQDGNVSTAISSQQIRIVLKWGENPSDLDSHLVGPTSSGEKFHIYFMNKNYKENSEKVADLDLDDISSYGPETTTIYNPVSGKYQFYVLNYSDRHSSESSALASSGATVQVYIGASNKPLYTFNVPQNEGTLWKVFEYDSVTKKITPINQMSYESNSNNVGMN